MDKNAHDRHGWGPERQLASPRAPHRAALHRLSVLARCLLGLLFLAASAPAWA